MTDLGEAYDAFRTELIQAGLLVETGVAGLYGRNGEFEQVVAGINRAMDFAGRTDHVEHFGFAPIMSRRNYERTDHLKSFPDLMGALHSFRGGDIEHRALTASYERGEDWTTHLRSTDMMLCPAACYPLYPMLSGKPVPLTGRIFDVVGYCFRHEPSPDPARMQMFRMHENVFVGTPDDAVAFRDRWIDRCLEVLGGLGLDVRAEVANDPFFGRVGKMLKANQRESHLKYEIVAPICSDELRTAIASSNCHQDHLTVPFNIELPGGQIAHSACVGFGLERITLALFKRHGLIVAAWPIAVRDKLFS